MATTIISGNRHLSKYARSTFDGGMTGDADVITPITDREAQAWLEQHGEVEAIEEYFSVEDA